MGFAGYRHTHSVRCIRVVNRAQDLRAGQSFRQTPTRWKISSLPPPRCRAGRNHAAHDQSAAAVGVAVGGIVLMPPLKGARLMRGRPLFREASVRLPRLGLAECHVQPRQRRDTRRYRISSNVLYCMTPPLLYPSPSSIKYRSKERDYASRASFWLQCLQRRAPVPRVSCVFAIKENWKTDIQHSTGLRWAISIFVYAEAASRP